MRVEAGTIRSWGCGKGGEETCEKTEGTWGGRSAKVPCEELVGPGWGRDGNSRGNEKDVIGNQEELELGLSLPFPCPFMDLQSRGPWLELGFQAPLLYLICHLHEAGIGQ